MTRSFEQAESDSLKAAHDAGLRGGRTEALCKMLAWMAAHRRRIPANVFRDMVERAYEIEPTLRDEVGAHLESFTADEIPGPRAT